MRCCSTAGRVQTMIVRARLCPQFPSDSLAGLLRRCLNADKNRALGGKYRAARQSSGEAEFTDSSVRAQSAETSLSLRRRRTTVLRCPSPSPTQNSPGIFWAAKSVVVYINGGLVLSRGVGEPSERLASPFSRRSDRLGSIGMNGSDRT